MWIRQKRLNPKKRRVRQFVPRREQLTAVSKIATSSEAKQSTPIRHPGMFLPEPAILVCLFLFFKVAKTKVFLREPLGDDSFSIPFSHRSSQTLAASPGFLEAF